MSKATENLDPFTRHYIKTALWSTNDNSDESGGEPLDANYDIDKISPRTLAKMKADCRDFQRANKKALAMAYERDPNYGPASAGNDFWLTREGHGAGFWDRGLGDAGEALTKASKPYGDFNLYVNRGRIVSGGYEPKTRSKALRSIVKNWK